MKRHWLYYITPFVIAAIGCVIPIVMGLAALNKYEGYDKILVIIFLPACLLLLGVDYVIKSLTKGNVNYIWIIEALVVGAVLITWRYAL